ncbi:MAG: phosphate/phosphite/phosphonate ABC transporter substrate-binding protein [Gammaproteobacteria bacterium]|nr:phosphate/phosphite/phosphonate ABC transporter substrate-binding protein [Gammaproteobacteria bacterium]
MTQKLIQNGEVSLHLSVLDRILSRIVILNRSVLPLIFLSIICSFIPVSAIASTVNTDVEYSFGVFPYLPSQQMLKTYGPVTADLSQKLGTSVRLRTAASFAKFERNLSQEIYDIAVIQPFDYPKAIDKYKYFPVARMSDDLITTFMVREDNPYTSLQDLKGKRVAFAPISAANSQMGLAHLRSLGIDPETDINATYQRSHESCLQQIWLKKAAACVTAKPMVDLFEKKRKVKFKILAKTRTIPHILYVVHERVPKAQREKLLQSILRWNTNVRGQQIIKSMGFSGFSEAKDEQYDVMRELVYEKSSISKPKTRNNLSLGIFPYFPPKNLAQLFGGVPNVFSHVLDGVEIKLKTASSYEQFNQNVDANMYDIVLIQPFDYYRLVSLGFKPVARVSGSISASIFVNRESPVRTLDQLKGKTLSMPPREAAVTRLVLSDLKKKEMSPGKDLILEYKNTHVSCLRQIKFNISEACASASEVIDMLPGEFTDNIREVYRTESVPHLVLMVSSGFSVDMRRKLTEEVLNWKNTDEGRLLLEQMKLRPFVSFVEKDYTGLKNIQ